MFKFGTVVLVSFPFTDLTSSKLRPAVIISRTNGRPEDVILCFISSKISGKKDRSHFIFRTGEDHFMQTGLKTDSLVRFDKIATLSKKLILGEIGSFHKTSLEKMKHAFSAAFGF